MKKTTYLVKNEGKLIGKRGSANAYTHAVVVRRSFEYSMTQTERFEGAELKAAVESVLTRRDAGEFKSYHIRMYTSRHDLAVKEMNRARSTGWYSEVLIVPVEVQA